jgi:hypothetical protein
VLFETVAGCVGRPGTPGVFWRGLRTVAIDATSLHVPDRPAVTSRYRKRVTGRVSFGYPLLRLSVLVECGTRAILAATFGPEVDGETCHARRLVDAVGQGMLVLADAGYDSWELLPDIAATKAQYLRRSGARRTPLILTELSDGSYVSVFGYGKLKVRVIEAWLIITWADGTVSREQWRLVTSLLDHAATPPAN